MNPDRAFLLEAAAATGFPAVTLEKVIRLGELAAEIAKHPLLGPALALKGGTALNLAFGEPHRLSVDLDFNVVGHPELDRLERIRPEIERGVENVARALSYRVQRSRAVHAGRKLFLIYRSPTGPEDRVEVDLNYLFRIPVSIVAERELWMPPGIARPVVPVMSLEEIAAGKLTALLDRAAPRDLFDAPLLPEKLGVDWLASRFRRLFVYFAGVLPRPLWTYDRSRIDRVGRAIIERQLSPVLRAGTSTALPRLCDEAWRTVEPLLHLDEAEREYTDRLQLGELVPSLLFPDQPDLCEKLARHPALLWKAKNAAEHARKGRAAAAGEPD